MNLSTTTLLRCSQSQALRSNRAYATIADDRTGNDGKGKGKGKGKGEGNGKDAAPPNPYPFPSHKDPTALQIFHLRPGASQEMIKKRYFELVRTHHPDAPLAAHLAPNVAHDRFRAVKAAYDYLSGRATSPHPNARPPPDARHFDAYEHELARRRRAYNAARSSDAGWEDDHSARSGGFAEGHRRRKWEDNWKQDGSRERTILALGIFALIGGLFPYLPGTLYDVLFSSGPIPGLLSSSTSASASTSAAYSSSSPSADDATSDDALRNSPSIIPFLDLDKNHRNAAAALAQARVERREMGAERREGVRKRVREMRECAGDRDEQDT